jgi:NADH-quinone oxidoreductase subunit J
MEAVQPLLFWMIALVTGLCAVATVVSQNIVRSATWLLFTLAGTSGIFFLLGADLVGAIQLLVYVGGTLVLVVFGVMLTAQGPFINMKTSGAEWAISALAGILLLAVLAVGITSMDKDTDKATGRLQPPEGSVALKYAPKEPLGVPSDSSDPDKSSDADKNMKPAKSPYSTVIGEGFLGVGVGPAHEERIGTKRKIVRANYLLPFEIVSVHLLVVLIGAAYLARAKRRRRVAS